MKTCLISLWIVIMLSWKSMAQITPLNFPVIVNSDSLGLAWAGGLNYPQVSTLFANNDAIRDIFIFERTGNRTLVFLGTNNPDSFIYAYDYSGMFPPLHDWALLRDYNCDGRKDIFSYSNGGMEVYLNTGSNGILSFQKVTSLLNSRYSSGTFNLYISQVDIPSIDDIDNDGDLDILTFTLGGTTVEYHKNLSMETFGTCDSLKYELQTSCWGNFSENVSTNSVTLNSSCKGGEAHQVSQSIHTGSSLVTFDADADNDKEILLGDISFNNMVYLVNGGTAQFANMTSQQPDYPAIQPVNIPLFPAGYIEDVNHDGARDLLVAPNAGNISVNKESLWYYENTGADNLPNFSLVRKNFLQDEMIDLGEGAYPLIVDMNTDGLPDLISGNYGYYQSGGTYLSGIAYFKNTGTINQPVFTFITDDLGNIQSLGLNGVSPAAGDIDADGDVDLLIGEKNGMLHLLLNSAGAGNEPILTFTTSNFQGIDVGQYSTPCLFDYNGDNKLDLFIGERSGVINYYENTGTSAAPSYTLITETFGNITVTEPGFITGYSTPQVVRYNGQPVILSGSEKGNVYLFKDLSPTGSVIAEPMLTGRRQGLRTSVTLGNLTGNPEPEYIIGNYSGGLMSFEGPLPVSLKQITKSDPGVKIFPNPSRGILFVQVSQNPEMIIISDVSGRKILSLKPVGDNLFEADVSKLSNGAYFCQVQFKNGSKYQKFIISR